jgi:hypothetical protein
MITWLRKWRAFFFPPSEWKERLIAVRRGQTVWEVPGKPECNKVIPWPLDWVPHRLYNGRDDLTDEESARGFALLEASCVDTGQTAAVGQAVHCVRCTVPLHPHACRTSGFQPPACRRCAFLISRVR